MHDRAGGRCPWVHGRREEPGREAGRERGAETHSLAGAEDLHPVIRDPHAQNRDQLGPARSWAETGCCKMCWDITQLRENPGTGVRGEEQMQSRPQGWSNPTGRGRVPAPAAHAAGHFQPRVREQGTRKEKHPALQLERRRNGTWCFEFKKLQVTISQGIRLIHLG